MPVVDPYRPAAQSLHTPDPDTLYFPTAHTAAVADTDACTQKYPALQLPLHPTLDRPLVAPYSPAAQSTHAPHPDSEYRPGGHMDAVALVDPATHAYPAVQLAVQLDTDRPDTDPYRPVSQGPLQAAVDMAVVAPNSPALQLVQTPAPTRLNVPTGHVTAVARMDTGGQAKPGAHAPEHPGSAIAVEAPYRPAAQSLHIGAPERLYVPTGQGNAVPLVDPAGQKYPGLHGPSHPEVTAPPLDPKPGVTWTDTLAGRLPRSVA
jgi:hypothetical protein